MSVWRGLDITILKSTFIDSKKWTQQIWNFLWQKLKTEESETSCARHKSITRLYWEAGKGGWLVVVMLWKLKIVKYFGNWLVMFFFFSLIYLHTHASDVVWKNILIYVPFNNDLKVLEEMLSWCSYNLNVLSSQWELQVP